MSEQLAAFGLTLAGLVAATDGIVEKLANLKGSQRSIIAGQAGIMDQLVVVNRTLAEMNNAPDDGLAKALEVLIKEAKRLLTEVAQIRDKVGTRSWGWTSACRLRSRSLWLGRSRKRRPSATRSSIVDAPRWKKQGLYLGYLDGRPNGYARNYLTGEECRWRFSGQLSMTFAEASAAKLAADARLPATDNASRRRPGSLRTHSVSWILLLLPCRRTRTSSGRVSCRTAATKPGSGSSGRCRIPPARCGTCRRSSQRAASPT